MKNKYLVVNCGSSSLKFSLYLMPDEVELINGYIEKIGLSDSFWTIKIKGEKISDKRYLANHTEAVEVMIEELFKNKVIESLDEIIGIGHRVLHGGEYYNDSVMIDDDVLTKINSLVKLGPLHLPGEIAGIEAMKEKIPEATQVAVFDTAFHQTMSKANYIYAVPYEWYTNYGVRRYGFHGTSHKYITEVMKKKLMKEEVNLIICHVGSGASVSCVRNSKCFDTSMGLTPLDGLIMGTRSGEIDPSIIKYMMNEGKMDINEIDDVLNKQSGLLGICGKSDFRDMLALREQGDDRAILAYEMYRDAIIKHIAEYYFELEGDVDAVVFTAGVLENNVMLREDIIRMVSKTMRVKLDKKMNDNIGYGHEYREGRITDVDSEIPFYVIPTSEEIMIARDTYRIVNDNKNR